MAVKKNNKPAVKKSNKPGGKDDPMNIVAIGASAGGLNALKEFFSHVPADTGYAFVVIVHLSPQHKSALPEILQSSSNMPVQQVTKTTKMKPDHVYVIPPNSHLNSVDTHLRLSDLEEKRSERAPIDHFFRTLSKTHDGHAVGIILTGTGSDGTLGIKDIKERGGLTLAQDPREAEYEDMPQSAISTGMVDYVLPLAKIPEAFLGFAATVPRIKTGKTKDEPVDGEVKLLDKIFTQIRIRTGRDFSHYKLTTLLRRIQRRMQINRIEELDDYLKLIRAKQDEVKALADDLLINVTNFFRDPDAFNFLQEETIPAIYARKEPGDEIRVWSVGCATGEEAYSIAMLLIEEAERMESKISFKLFASDIHEVSLKKAREGYYPGDIDTEVGEERLKRFFTKENGGYRVKKELREQVVFTPQNLLSDPPFSRTDLIVCRNLFIYLKRDIQNDVRDLFHYALNPAGFLMLGTSEHLENTNLFGIINKEYSIYIKRNVSGPEPRLPVFPKHAIHHQPETYHEKEKSRMAFGTHHQNAVERYAPPSILVSSDYQVLHVSRDAGRYLTITGGELSKELYKLIRPELHVELRAAIYISRETKDTARSKPVEITIDGQKRVVFISVRFIEDEEFGTSFLIMFEDYDVKAVPVTGSSSGKTDEGANDRVQQLEQELKDKSQNLQAVIEEHEIGQEEMKASNEELQSANEELRSTMEELETSKEELQSVNEELSALNQEHRHKAEELGQLSDDLQNLLTATDIATLFLDREMRILRFTPRLGELFNVRMADRGRPISDQTHKLGYNELVEDARKVLENLQPIHKEIKDNQGNTYLTRLLPYRSSADRIEGVVINFIDISDRKLTEKHLQESENRFRALVSASSYIVYRMDPDMKKIQELDESKNQQSILPFDKWLKTHVHADDRRMVKEEMEKASDDRSGVTFEHRVFKDDGTARWSSTSIVPLFNDEGELTEWFGSVSDISVRKNFEEELKKSHEKIRLSEERLKLIIESATDYAIITLDTERIVTDWNAGAEKLTGYSKSEIIGKKGDILFVPEDRATQPEREMQIAVTRGRAENERWHLRKDGRRFWGSGITAAIKSKNGLTGFLKIMRDHTGRTKMEENLRQAKLAAEQAARAKEEFLALMSHEIRTPLNAIVGLSHLILQKDPNPGQMENLNALKYSAENLQLLINDILDLSVIQAGKITIHPDKINIREFLNNIVQFHLPVAQNKQLELTLETDSQVPEMIIIDKVKLAQVLNNLLINAIKFTPKGHVRLKTKLNRKEDQRLWIDFMVEDTGIGIPKDKAESIFDVFSQVDNSVSRMYGGTGLGLTLCRLFLEKMDSRIELESEPGKGSSFFFTLPVKEYTGKEDKPGLSTDKHPGHLKKLKILLVEDDEINRMMIRQFLQNWKLDFKEASNGKEAINMAQKQMFDLIIMDVRMPVIDGFEATYRIRKIPGYENIPIIALTADVSQKVRDEKLAGLFDEIIIKPVNPDDLIGMISLYSGEKEATVDGSAAANPQKEILSTIRNNDPEAYMAILEQAKEDIEYLGERYPRIIDQGDAEALHELKHKHTTMISFLGAHELSRQLADTIDLLNKNATDGRLDELKGKILENMDNLKDNIDKMIQEASQAE
jgi:two-component system, chemotaxis family, CheB/CheR fusion protein